MILITYDLKTDHTRIKKALKAKGWKEQIAGESGVVCNLPNTSLWKDGTDTVVAREEVQSVVSEPNLERLICVYFSGWAAIKGQAFAG